MSCGAAWVVLAWPHRHSTAEAGRSCRVLLAGFCIGALTAIFLNLVLPMETPMVSWPASCSRPLLEWSFADPLAWLAGNQASWAQLLAAACSPLPSSLTQIVPAPTSKGLPINQEPSFIRHDDDNMEPPSQEPMAKYDAAASGAPAGAIVV